MEPPGAMCMKLFLCLLLSSSSAVASDLFAASAVENSNSSSDRGARRNKPIGDGGCAVTEGFYSDKTCTTAVAPPPYNMTSNPLAVPEGECVQSLTSGAGTECVSCTSGDVAELNLWMDGCGVGDAVPAYAYEGQCLYNGAYYERISCGV